jgi:hypothetical protein
VVSSTWTGTPVAIFIIVYPVIQVKSIKRHALFTDRDFGEMWPDFGIEAMAVHTEIVGSIPQTDQTREKPGLIIATGVHSTTLYTRVKGGVEGVMKIAWA